MLKKQLRNIGLTLFLIVCLNISSVFAEEAANETNAAVLYEKAGSMLTDISYYNFLENTRNIRENGWVGENEDVKKILRENRAAINEFKRATELENCDFTFGKEIKRTISTPVPPHFKESKLAKLTILEGRLQETEGKYKLALKNYLAVLKFADHMNQQDKFFTSKLSGVRAQDEVYFPLERYIKREGLNSQDYRSLLINLVSLKMKRTGLESAFEAENECTKSAARSTARNIEKLIMAEKMKPKEQKQYKVFLQKFFQEFYRETDKITDELYNHIIIAFEENKPEVCEEKIKQFNNEAKNEMELLNLIKTTAKGMLKLPKGKYYSSLIAELLASIGETGVVQFSPSITKYYLSQAKFDILTTAVAVKLYELEKGKTPDILQELTPDYLPAVFADPFNDFKPLKYKKQNDSWVIYSFGPDKQDDNADFECKEIEEKGDIIFSAL